MLKYDKENYFYFAFEASLTLKYNVRGNCGFIKEE